MGAADEQERRAATDGVLREPHDRRLWLGERYVAHVRKSSVRPADVAEEIQWRLLAIRAVIEREGRALRQRHDERLLDVLVEIDELKLSIARTLGALGAAGTPARDS